MHRDDPWQDLSVELRLGSVTKEEPFAVDAAVIVTARIEERRMKLTQTFFID